MNDASIGHNSAAAPDNDPLLERLSKSYKPQIDLRDELVAAFARIQTKEITIYGRTVKAVVDEKMKEGVGIFVKKCRALAKQAKDIHGDEKKELLATTRKIDAFFLQDIVKKIDALKDDAEQLCANFDAAIIEAEEKRLEEERKAAEADAAQKAAEAAKIAESIKTEDDLEVALAAQDDAEQAALNAQAAAADAASLKPLEVTRTTSSAGVTQSTNINWTGRIVNLAEIDLNVLKPYFKLSEIEDACHKFGKATKGTLPAKGIVVERDFKSRTR